MEMKALLLCGDSESTYVLSDVLGELEVSLELCHDRDQALDRLLNERGPLLAHVSIEQAENVWPLVPPAKSNAEMVIGDHNK